ncbi:AP-2 adaptor complex subunit Apl1 [Schizosaccharomyces cryophilus OY26]|uniref:AP complex subunit beta n=1 Tax=Schizosaccharomyces cryophilus (strain OY26 / ATCC MYA-4695 / CBS 11777 / NBRC 106824 / NRRL Y48691) TaxID=653667 RepID=S9VX01_SCHCR|nr:AP-2 adaptor complex subunit Apl1 [Schizosaccharomyces cryophilus OY26]EPY50480.1 AP-2 adaptor complex subunit Apl1 [Schizosaccharomyces cryophilus OY26]
MVNIVLPSGNSSHSDSSELSELEAILRADSKDKSATKRIGAMKKIIANMSMGYDMTSLFAAVISCMETSNVDLKKLCYLYLKSFARLDPSEAKKAIPVLLKGVYSSNPVLRDLSLKTLTSIHIKNFWVASLDPIIRLLDDIDPYVRKTAVMGVARIYSYDRKIVESSGLMKNIKEMLNDESAIVVANALAVLISIVQSSDVFKLTLTKDVTSKIIDCLSNCSEWLQTIIFDSLICYVPQKPGEAENFAERISPWLQHGNTAVCMGAIKAVLYFINYMSDDLLVKDHLTKVVPPLVTMLARKSSPTQYVLLRNVELILDAYPEIFQTDLHFFFCHFDDPAYVKLEKFSILAKLANEENLDHILPEFMEYASEVDVELSRKSVRYIGHLAVQIESRADDCVDCLVELIDTKITYVVQEAAIIIRDIMRKYPNRYKHLLSILLKNIEFLDEPEAKAAFIWLLGHYAESVENSCSLMEEYVDGFLYEPLELQLTILTAVTKLFLKLPAAGSEMVTKILQLCIEEIQDPDLRDRGIIYSRMLSTNPELARKVILTNAPSVDVKAGTYDPDTTEQLLLNVGTLSSVYHKPPNRFARGSFPQYLEQSPVLRQQANLAANSTGDLEMEYNLQSSSTIDGNYATKSEIDVNSGGLWSQTPLSENGPTPQTEYVSNIQFLAELENQDEPMISKD